MTVLIGDLESDGFKDVVSKIHCMWTATEDGSVYTGFSPSNIDELKEHLEGAEALVFHNGIDYDYPVIRKFYPDIKFPELIDTLVLSRLVYPNLYDIDQPLVKKYMTSRGVAGLPPKLQGSHSLKAWGYRLGLHKGEYGEGEGDVWATFNDSMYQYCKQDVAVTVKLYAVLKKKFEALGLTQLPFKMEHKAQTLMTILNEQGFKFDAEKGAQLAAKLSHRRFELAELLIEKYGSWWASAGVTKPKKTITYKDKTRASITEGAPYTKLKLVQFNPASRDHIAKKLQEHGWTPNEFTETGKPKINDDILDSLDIPEAAYLIEYLTVQKRLSQLAEGKNAWLLLVTEKGFIHHSVNPNGAVTTRSTHSRPNLAQVPAVKSLYGAECRELFTVPDGWVMFGSDASGLELRCLGHYLEEFDGGAYISEVLDGDVHTANMKAAGLMTRDEAKRFIYTFLYGGGDELIGQLIGYTEKEKARWIKKGMGKPVVAQLRKRGIQPTAKMICHILKGREVKKQFLKGLPALSKLIDKCKEAAKTKGFVEGVDGRRIYTRSQRAALNSLLQSAGALICKLWLIRTFELAEEAGLKHSYDGDFVLCAHVHDEMQVACRTPEVAEQFKKFSAQAMNYAHDIFDFKCRLDVDCKVGKNWKETH